jgi:hypothetical protein
MKPCGGEIWPLLLLGPKRNTQGNTVAADLVVRTVEQIDRLSSE